MMALVSAADISPVSLGVVIALLWTVLAIHQLGHYYAGRQIAGIPAAEMTLVSPLVPRHIALRDDDGWVPPTEFDRYREAYERHDPELEHLERFVAGGEIIQVAVVVPAAIALALAGVTGVATVLVVVSLATIVASALADAVRTRRTGDASGTYSALWEVTPRVPVLILIGVTFVHLGAFSFIL